MKLKQESLYKIVSPEELTYQDFIDMYNIDRSVLREDLIATPNITYAWYQHNPYTHIAIRNTSNKKIIGYITVLPVTDKLYQKIQSGNFKDNDLSIDEIRQYNMSGFYKLYAAAVCVHRDYQNTSVFYILYHALIDMLHNLAINHKIYISDIITEASTKQGEKLCKILGLKKMIDTNLGTKLYITSVTPEFLQIHHVVKRLNY